MLLTLCIISTPLSADRHSEEPALIFGTKIEHNDFTGFEYQPSARLAYTPDDKQTLWTSVTRAVRTPSRFDMHSKTSWGTTMIGPFVYSLEASGDDNMEPERPGAPRFQQKPNEVS